MVLEIFHRGSINLIKSLSTGEITVFLTFGKRIIISFKEIWLAEDVEWGKITKSERRQSIYKCIKVPITLANESIRVLAKSRWLSDNISLSDKSITNNVVFGSKRSSKSGNLLPSVVCPVSSLSCLFVELNSWMDQSEPWNLLKTRILCISTKMFILG